MKMLEESAIDTDFFVMRKEMESTLGAFWSLRYFELLSFCY